MDKTGNPVPIIFPTLDKNESPYTFTSWKDAETAIRFLFDGPEKRKDFENSGFYIHRFER